MYYRDMCLKRISTRYFCMYFGGKEEAFYMYFGGKEEAYYWFASVQALKKLWEDGHGKVVGFAQCIFT